MQVAVTALTGLVALDSMQRLARMARLKIERECAEDCKAIFHSQAQARSQLDNFAYYTCRAMITLARCSITSQHTR